MTDRPTLTDDEIRRRIAALEVAPTLNGPAERGELRALREVLALRARVAELERAVREAARQGYECGVLDAREADYCTDVDAIAAVLLDAPDAD